MAKKTLQLAAQLPSVEPLFKHVASLAVLALPAAFLVFLGGHVIGAGFCFAWFFPDDPFCHVGASM